MNIKKFTQKDRYGNSMSFEFEVPPMDQGVPTPPGHPGAMPVGTDTVPAMLTPGEFVMNAEATRMFKPQIEAMNNAGRVQQKSQGGSVPTQYRAGGGHIRNDYAGAQYTGAPDEGINNTDELLKMLFGALGSAADINEGNYGMAVLGAIPGVRPLRKAIDRLDPILGTPLNKVMPNKKTMEKYDYENDWNPIREPDFPKPKPKESAEAYLERTKNRRDPVDKQRWNEWDMEPPEPDLPRSNSPFKQADESIEEYLERTRGMGKSPADTQRYNPEADSEYFSRGGQVNYLSGGGMPTAAQIDDETATFLRMMEQLRQQQNQPSIMQGFIPGNEQIPAGKMVGSQGVQPVIPMDVPPTVQLPTPMEVQQAVPGQETVMPIRTQGGNPIDAMGKVYSGRGQAAGAVPPVFKPEGQGLYATPDGVYNTSTNTYIDKMTKTESGGKADAKNPRSSATGLHQFTKGTWKAIVERYEPDLAKGLTEDELMELRKNPEISTRMAGYLTDENRGILEKKGIEATDTNLYLAHFAGPSKAARLIQGNPDTPAEEIFTEAEMRANPHLKGKTAAQVVAWANKHMSNLGNGAGDGVNIPGISSAEAGQRDPAIEEALSKGDYITAAQLAEKAGGMNVSKPPRHGPTGGVPELPMSTDPADYGSYGDVGDPNAVPVGGTPESIPEVMADVPVEINKDMNKPDAKTGFNLTEDKPKGGRGSEAPVSPEAQVKLNEIVDKTESQVPESELDMAIDQDEALRKGEIELAKRKDDPSFFSKLTGIFKSLGLDELFDSKELARMGVMYLGSRALGYSHVGSIRWAAKQYVSRVDAKATAHDKMVEKLTSEGKYDARSIAKFKKSKDINDLVPSPKKLIPTGKTPFILVDGKRVKVQEVKDEDGGVYYRDANGQVLNTMNPRVSDYQAEWDKKDTTGAYIKRSEESKAKAAEIFKSISNFSPADGSGPMGYQDMGDKGKRSYVNFTPEDAAGDFVTWAESQVPPLDSRRPEVQAMMGNAYREALAQGRKGKPTGSLIPFLEGQKIREETGTQELFMTNHEEWIDKDKSIVPHYIDASKMTALRANVAALARQKYGSDSPANVKSIFDYVMKKWDGMDKGPYDSPPEGETPFYRMMNEMVLKELTK